MVYTEEVRKKLDAILKAFEEYIDSQNYFDVVYSKKIGYVWILAECPGDAGAVLLDTPEKMLDQLFNEVINDVVNADENKTHPKRIFRLIACLRSQKDDYVSLHLQEQSTMAASFINFHERLWQHL